MKTFAKLVKMRRLLLFALIALVPVTVVAYAARERPVILGQTEGFADGELVVFDYTDNFVCANALLNDEECDLGAGANQATNPNIGDGEQALLNALDLDPNDTPDLIVIVPFFDGAGDPDNTLDAVDDTPGVDVQCPENQTSALAGGTPFGVFGHCIFHDHELDTSTLTGVTIANLDGSPSSVTFGTTLPTIIPLPNHTHIVEETPGGSVPWDTTALLVFDPSIWPDTDGNCLGTPCLTSFEAVFSATQAPFDAATLTIDASQGQVFGPVDTSLFLFFGVHGLEP
ncbi:MAG: hypothetical protein ACE5K9_12065 [Candidatus Methylomirabilales bacterium]